MTPGQRLSLPSGNVIELRGSHHDALGGLWRCCYVRWGIARPGREHAHLLTLRADWLLRYGRAAG